MLCWHVGKGINIYETVCMYACMYVLRVLVRGSIIVEINFESILMLFEKLHVKVAFENITQPVNIHTDKFDGGSICVIECVLQKAEAQRLN